MANIGYVAGPELLPIVYKTLQSLPFPFNTDTGRKPSVILQGTTHDEQAEQIELMGTIADGDVEWKHDGGRLVAEICTLTIVIRTAVPGKTGPEALDRANVLSRVVQAGFRDQTTGLPKGITDTVTPARVLDTYRVSGYDTDPFPVADQGWGYDLTLRLRVTAHH